MLGQNEYDIILVTETWLKSYHTDSYLCSTAPYFVIRSDRHDDERGGGVCAFVKLEFSTYLNVIKSISQDKEFDIIVFDLHLEQQNSLRFVCVYLPPDSTKDIDIVKNFINILSQIVILNITYLFGDFNFSKVCWKNNRIISSSSSNEFNHFLNFLSKYDLVQLINQSTHNSDIL